jgi:hypothetical protein
LGPGSTLYADPGDPATVNFRGSNVVVNDFVVSLPIEGYDSSKWRLIHGHRETAQD